MQLTLNTRPAVAEKRYPRRVTLDHRAPTKTSAIAEAETLLAKVANDAKPGTPANTYPGGLLGFVTPGDLVFTPDQASLVTRNCVHQLQAQIRPLDHPTAKEHIDTLASIMRVDAAWLGETQIRFGLLDGRLWLMDGNHRIRAQANAAVSIPWNVKVDNYETEQDFRSAFHKFNTNTRIRTQAQILGAAGFASEHGITKQTASALYNAVPFIVLGFRSARSGRTEDDVRKSRIVDVRMDIAFKHVNAALALDECLKKADGKVKKKILVAGVTAVALVTLGTRTTSIAAKEFWRGLARNDGLKKGDPRHTLAMYLISEPLNAGASAAAAAAWNAWYEGRTLNVIRIGDAESVRIAGTPFKGA